MPAAWRQSERRPSAPIARAPCSTSPLLSVTSMPASLGAIAATSSSIRRSAGNMRAFCSRAATRWRFSILAPKASSPISSAVNLTSGARHSRPVSSTSRIVRIGAAFSAHSSQTPSVASAVTEPPSRAVVRVSGMRGTFSREHGRNAGASERDARRSGPPVRRRPRLPCRCPICSASKRSFLLVLKRISTTRTMRYPWPE